MPIRRLAAVVFLFALSLAAQGAGDAMVLATPHSLASAALGEQRKVWVHLPDGYEAATDRYPVLLLLDGPDHLLHTAGTAQFLVANGQMPALILVGVENTDRMRDMTPMPDAKVPGAAQGGADNFLKFLCDELVPWLDGNYRTRPTRFLIGHSLGGLVALHALRTRPDFFAGMIAISPSMQWAAQGEVDQLTSWLGTHPKLTGSLYVTAANEKGLVGAVYRTIGLFDVEAPAGLRWKFHHMPEETHQTVPYRSTHEGLRFLFEDWRIEGGAAAVLDGTFEAAIARVSRAHARYGFDYETGIFERLDILFELLERGEVARAQQFVADAALPDHGITPLLATMVAQGVAASDQPADVQQRAQLDALATTFLQMAVAADPWHEASRALLGEKGVAVPPATECEVAAEQLGRRVGDFTGNHRSLQVTLVDGHLQCVVDGGPAERLFAKTPSESWTASGKGVVFHEAAAGGYTLEFVTVERETMRPARR